MALKRVTYTQLTVMLLTDSQVEGRGGCKEALAVMLSEAASSADLGGSSKYSNENFED
jgi:hypothetical protein